MILIYVSIGDRQNYATINNMVNKYEYKFKYI